MLTLALYGVLAIVLIAGLFLVLTRVLPPGEQIAPAVRDEPLWRLPGERALTADELATVRLPVAVRGYRFAETDQLLDRLVDELRERDEQLARLRGEQLARLRGEQLARLRGTASPGVDVGSAG